MSLFTALLGCLLLPSLSSLDASKMNITNFPERITARVGDSVQMVCCWETQLQNLEQLRLEWWKNNQSKLSSLNYKKVKGAQRCEENKYTYCVSRNCSEMTIPSVSENDTGSYSCKIIIEIPLLMMAQGLGTTLIVNAKETDTQGSSAVLTVFPILLVLLGVSLLWYWKRKKLTSYGPGLAPRIADAAPGESGALDQGEEDRHNEIMEENSNSSRGSTHWALSAIYESFDYFNLHD
ncbi:uncharacterized protein [Lepisosteus oculatus]|uniref:uncharacterized protein isoform X1 n=1 Tax=Lepisosteus oculatus TaxID=7918 RepID=UPI0035F520D5